MSPYTYFQLFQQTLMSLIFLLCILREGGRCKSLNFKLKLRLQANHLFGKGVCLSHYNLVANIEQTLAPGIMPIVEYKGESENQGSLILLSIPGGEGKIQPEEEKGEKIE